jgi:hypothetical protein
MSTTACEPGGGGHLCPASGNPAIEMDHRCVTSLRNPGALPACGSLAVEGVQPVTKKNYHAMSFGLLLERKAS